MYSKWPWEVKPEEVDKPYIRIHEDVHPREADETRHNARLIAASPEMFELLLDINGNYHFSVEHQKQLNDLILKVGLK